MLRTCIAVLTFTFAAFPQTPTPSSIQASGSATINGIQPDQVQLSAGVITSAKTAQDAATQNAAQTSAVIAALNAVLGGSGSVQTISYTLSPQYTGANGGTPQTITGYTATNTVQVTTSNLNLAGQLIDAANTAGANNIYGPNYSLQNSDPFRQQALTAATKQALAHAAAIAAGLGMKTGAVISAQEGGTVTPVVMGAAPSGGTPIQTGTVSVTASVTVTVALVQ
ncbi:MAG TPA: SIMPL domain-containing protein [Bryobacteraceae bacterium]|nr:SIMPL domain-containing protein [Bryobacteraceae bacterium]